MKLAYRNSDRLIMYVGIGEPTGDWYVNSPNDYTMVDILEYPIIMGASRYTEDGVIELIIDYSPF